MMALDERVVERFKCVENASGVCRMQERERLPAQAIDLVQEPGLPQAQEPEIVQMAEDVMPPPTPEPGPPLSMQEPEPPQVQEPELPPEAASPAPAPNAKTGPEPMSTGRFILLVLAICAVSASGVLLLVP